MPELVPDAFALDDSEPHMLEVEIKYRYGEWNRLREVLAAWGATNSPPRCESDSYFTALNRDFAETGEALRLRHVGKCTILTYKGPKQDGPAKARVEHELTLLEKPNMAWTAVQMLTSLGYKPFAVVEKLREVFRFRRGEFDIEVCFDDVGGVGRHVELEIRCEEPHARAAALLLVEIAGELGLTDKEPLSYLELTLRLPKAARDRVRA